MPRRRQIRIPVNDFLEDVRAGFDDGRLMKKYKLTQKTLLKVFDKLVASGRVTQDELINRSPFINTQAVVDFLGNQQAIDELD